MSGSVQIRAAKRFAKGDRGFQRRLNDSKNLTSSPTRSKARAILERENVNVKKSKIHSFLLQQLLTSFGTKKPDSRVNEFIKRAVDEYIAGNNDVTEAEIQSLEAFVRNGTDKLKNSHITAREEQERQMKSEQQSRHVHVEESVRHRQPTPVNYADEVDTTQWTVVNAIMSAANEEQAEKEKQERDQRRMAYKKQLDDHKSKYQERKEAEKQAERELMMKQRRAELAFNAREDNKQENRGAKVMAERDVRLRQIEEKKARLDAAAAEKKRLEALEIARIKNGLEEDKRRAEALREAAARQNAATMAENDRFKAIKEERAEEIRREEQRMALEAEARAAREQARREREFQEKMDRQAQAMSRFADGAGAQQAAARATEEKLTQSLIEKKYREDEEREQRKRDHRAKEMAKSLRANAEIVERKRREKELERERDRELGARFQKEREDEIIERNESRQRQLEKMRAMRDMLNDQVNVRAQGVKDHGALTNLEVNLNKDILAKIRSDSTLAKRVHDRVKPKNTYRAYTNNIIG